MQPKRTPTTPCWTWSRALNDKGYGVVSRNGRLIGAHRFVYEALIEPVPEGLELDHLCFNSACVNPDHLEPVTHLVNMRRRRWNRLSMDLAREIRAAYAAGDVSTSTLGAKYGVSDEAIRLVIHERTWKEAA
jgi:hypothetical protein